MMIFTNNQKIFTNARNDYCLIININLQGMFQSSDIEPIPPTQIETSRDLHVTKSPSVTKALFMDAKIENICLI